MKEDYFKYLFPKKIRKENKTKTKLNAQVKEMH